jgi:hypothetical protein
MGYRDKINTERSRQLKPRAAKLTPVAAIQRIQEEITRNIDKVENPYGRDVFDVMGVGNNLVVYAANEIAAGRHPEASNPVVFRQFIQQAVTDLLSITDENHELYGDFHYPKLGKKRAQQIVKDVVLDGIDTVAQKYLGPSTTPT